MTVPSREPIAAGSEIEVLWNIDGDAVWWGATVEHVGNSPSDVVVATIVYHAKPELEYDVSRAHVTLIGDGSLIDGDVTMRWRRKGEVVVGAGCAPGDEVEEGIDFQDDPSQPASDVIRMALSHAIDERSGMEQRVLATKVSEALAAFSDEVRTTLQALGPDGELDDRVAQKIISSMASKMRNADAMSDGGGSECSFGST